MSRRPSLIIPEYLRAWQIFAVMWALPVAVLIGLFGADIFRSVAPLRIRDRLPSSITVSQTLFENKGTQWDCLAGVYELSEESAMRLKAEGLQTFVNHSYSVDGEVKYLRFAATPSRFVEVEFTRDPYAVNALDRCGAYPELKARMRAALNNPGSYYGVSFDDYSLAILDPDGRLAAYLWFHP